MVIQSLSLRMNINCLHVPVLDATDFQFFLEIEAFDFQKNFKV